MAIYAVTAGNTALAADLNQYKALLVDGTDTTTKLGIGATSAQAAATLALPQTASGGLGYGLQLAPTLTAAANADGLYIGYIKGAIATGTLTGLTGAGLLIDGGAISKTGTGTIANAYSLYSTAPTIGSTNWAAFLSGHIKSGGGTPTISNGTNCTVTVTGNDTAGVLTVGIAAGGVTTGATIATVTFASTYGATPAAVLVTDQGSTSTGAAWAANGSSATSFRLVSNTTISAGNYVVAYLVIG